MWISCYQKCSFIWNINTSYGYLPRCLHYIHKFVEKRERNISKQELYAKKWDDLCYILKWPELGVVCGMLSWLLPASPALEGVSVVVVMLSDCSCPPPPLDVTPPGHWLADRLPGVLTPGGGGWGRADVAWNVAIAKILCLWLHNLVRSSFPFCSGADHCLDAT